MRYFTFSEFDSPDQPGSGEMMDPDFLAILDEARDCAGIPFVISRGGGFRTVAYNRQLIKEGYPASRKSSHLLGLAADIYVTDSQARFVILDALQECGITRLGISPTFIHCDIDPNKPQHRIWVY
jgi:zinc D-Ala-D-Ala carboxypeptidase